MYAQTSWSDRGFSYPSVSPLLNLELFWITGQREYLDAVARVVDGYDLAPCGYEHTTNWGSLRNATYNAMLAALYHQASGDSDAYDYAKATVDFVLGEHEGFANVPANFSFLIGYDRAGGEYPRSPHHAAAFAKSRNAWELFGRESDEPGSVEFGYELRGGLAGGPERECGNYPDTGGTGVRRRATLRVRALHFARLRTRNNDFARYLGVGPWCSHNQGAGSRSLPWKYATVAWPSPVMPSRRRTWSTVLARISRSREKLAFCTYHTSMANF